MTRANRFLLVCLLLFGGCSALIGEAPTGPSTNATGGQSVPGQLPELLLCWAGDSVTARLAGFPVCP